MSKPVNKSMIGAFVLGALVLALAALMIVGSGKFLAKTMDYVMYFEGASVKGLNVGSPVMFRGVKIGSVTDVRLVFEPTELKFLIPVYAQLDTSKITVTGPALPGDYRYLKALVDKGLRAQLETQSFVTGQLMINLDFFPDKPARFVGLEKHVPEVPTIPSTLDQIAKDIQNLPWKELFDSARAAVQGIDQLMNSPALASSVKNIDQTFGEATKALKTINEELKPIIAEIKPILANIEDTTVLVRSSASKLDNALTGEKGVPAQLQQTFEMLQGALAKADETLEKVEELTGQNSFLAVQAGQAMDELTKAGRAMRALADYLDRHPESLIKGKRAP
ncbi:MAG: MlaD family protein [candidate division WOR-3 bacterium]